MGHAQNVYSSYIFPFIANCVKSDHIYIHLILSVQFSNRWLPQCYGRFELKDTT
jgi:hypothetical protein